MRKLLVGLSLSSVCCVSLAVVSPASQWSGFYVGANSGVSYNQIKAKTTVSSYGGYFSGNDGTVIANASKQNRHTVGGLIGLDTGYNWNISNYILGVEADANWFYIRNSKSNTRAYETAPASSFTTKSTVQSNWLFTLHPEFGYAFCRYLVYITGGLALSDVTYKYKFTDDAFSAHETASSTARLGWLVGSGIKVKITPDWSTQLSYEYVQFERKNATGSVTNSGGFAPGELSHQTRMHSNVITVGVSYFFS